VKLASYNSWLKWILLAALTLCSEYGAGQTAVLLRAASVSHDNIRLSDLLPPEASIEARRAGEQIDLGRTPQCHSVRMFEPSDLTRRTSSWPALQGLTCSGPVSVQRVCYPVRREAVQQLISDFAQEKQIPLPKSPLQWAELIYASKENPALEIEQALPDPARPVLQVRLRCVEHAVCPSFWVTVPAGQRSHLLSAATISGSAAVPRAVTNAALVESGQRVMLILDDPPMRIQLPVTCLQRGALGEQVRAMDPSTHRVFRAEVTGAGSLTVHL
jgi:hypothetical protein